VGRLDNIIARNRHPNRSRGRLMGLLAIGAILLVLLVLAVVTDLGIPPTPAPKRGGVAPEHTAPPPAKRADGVLLRSPARPAAAQPAPAKH
jgi:hypothetical protein